MEISKEQEKQILQATKQFLMRSQIQGSEHKTFTVVQNYLDKKIMDCEQSMSVSEVSEENKEE